MDLLEILTPNIFFPLYEWWIDSSRIEYLNQFEKTQFLSSAETAALQWRSLKAVLEHAYAACPFYKTRFQSVGLTPNDVKSPGDLLQLPPLAKEDIQNNLADLLARGYNCGELIKDATGGSTGKPLIFYYDTKKRDSRDAARIRHNRWSGWDIGQKMGVLWGASGDLQHKLSFKDKVRRMLLERMQSLDAFAIDNEKLARFTSELEQYKPQMILAYTNVAYLFAKHLQGRDHNIHPKAIIVSAETLSETKRELIESVFDCRVLNRYGSREIGLLASECLEQQGLHVNAENVFIEVVKNGRYVQPGEAGEVIVTDLRNYAMPFIRYQIGDVAIPMPTHACACGRGLPKLASIQGRVSDFVVTNDGRIIHGEFFTHLFYGVQGVKQFQLIQESSQQIILKVVRSKDCPETQILEIKRTIATTLGGQGKASVELQFVDEIPTMQSGKYRFTISKIPVLF